MARVQFFQPFNYTPSEDRRVSIQYKVGIYPNVRREAADAAIEKGVAVELKPAPRPRVKKAANV